MKTLTDIGEDELVSHLVEGLYRGENVVVAAGDDCAVVDTPGDRYQLLKTDCVVEGIHYELDESGETFEEGRRIGWKAMARTLSDIAAMGGVAETALVTVVLRPDVTVEFARELYDGLNDAAENYGVSIVGGETARPHRGDNIISVAMSGWVEKDRCCLRSGARVGDVLMVTGRLGGYWSNLVFEPRLIEARQLTQAVKVTAMMDLSDGLAADLPRLARASGVGYRVDFDAIPIHADFTVEEACTMGEDYELLFTVAPEDVSRAQDALSDLRVTAIGRITETVETPLEGGWKHY